MHDDQTSPNWSKLRFKWKEQIFESQDLSRGAKQMGVVLCDRYASRTSGKCWPSNGTLAKILGVTVRSVQRHIAELLAEGWIRIVPIYGKRRGIKLEFPARYEGDSRYGSYRKRLSPEHDSTVIPYSKKKEPTKNQRRNQATPPSFSVVFVAPSETQSLDLWRSWIAEKTDYEPAELMSNLFAKGKYSLPSRFPRDDAESGARYLAYFRCCDC